MMEYFARTQKIAQGTMRRDIMEFLSFFTTQPFLMYIFHLLTILQPFSSYNIIFQKKVPIHWSNFDIIPSTFIFMKWIHELSKIW